MIAWLGRRTHTERDSPDGLLEVTLRRFLTPLLLALGLCFGPAASAQLALATYEVTPPVALAEAVLAPGPSDTAIATPTTTTEAALPVVESWNPADWFKDAGLLALVVAFLVALIKRNFWKGLEGLGTLALSFALGIGLSLLGTVQWPGVGRFSELTGVAAIMFGVNASVFASGGWDVIKGVLMAAFGGKSRGAGAST